MNIQTFKEISRQYKTIFFDSYGVLRNYQGVYEGVREMLLSLVADGIDYYIITNDASRSPEQLAENFVERGLPEITTDKIISSGMIAKEYLSYKINHGKVAYLGTERSAHYIESVGIETISIGNVDLAAVDDISALVLLDDEGFDWNTDLTRAVNLLRKRSMPVVVANTDTTYPRSKDEVAISVGGVAKLLESLSQKTFIRFGKPDAQIFNFAYRHACEQKPVDKQEILMVGDTLKTDIIGGNKFGIDTCLVLSGNIQAKDAELLIASTGIIPDYICASVTA
ncbi:MAG: HAD-IIA family hydrolase [Prevotellaceae bacterium]|jgi:HAD superfamily hydrolase (TIGR01450 family)|nr:HAD-IIA family hydrolase [Prevotellaceae bacterium]